MGTNLPNSETGGIVGVDWWWNCCIQASRIVGVNARVCGKIIKVARWLLNFRWAQANLEVSSGLSVEASMPHWPNLQLSRSTVTGSYRMRSSSRHISSNSLGPAIVKHWLL